MSFFTELGLAEPITRALTAKGYDEPTPIQRQAIPSLLQGRDLLGIAQTGTGKTAAFMLPSLHRLAANPQPRPSAGCRMLILSPTRELAAQIAENSRFYAKHLDLNVQCIFGGVPVGKQARALTAGCDVLVATPGRLLDLIDQRALTLRHVEIFVLDEADQMMDLGFIVPLKRVAALLPKQRQSLFFSATMPKAIADLGKQFINNPVRVEVTPQATTADRVLQVATYLNQAEKQALLTIKLLTGLADGTIDRSLVFTRTKHGADRVARHLAGAGIKVAAIHGNKSQGQRTAAILGFRKGDIRVLVATDIAARGIDIPGVSHVFNFEMPNVAEQYVHRIGRTARNGAEGIAISFVAPDERAYLRDIEKLTGNKIGVLPLPDDFVKEAAKLPAPTKAPSGQSQDDRRSNDPRGGGRGRPAGGQGSGGGRSGGQRSGGQRSGGARPEFADRAPRRDNAERQPRSEGAAPVRQDGGDRQPRREGAEQPRRSFGEMPRAAEAPRSQPRRDGDDRRPRPSGGEQPRSGGDRPRTGGGDNRPRTSGGGDRPRGANPSQGGDRRPSRRPA